MKQEETGKGASDLVEEFSGVLLGDARLNARLLTVVQAASRQPEVSLPLQAGNSGNLEGTYRFLGNPKVTAEKILAPHIAKTAVRAASVEEVLLISDTTEAIFSGSATRKGLGYVRAKEQGFLAHVTIAATVSGKPLGVADLETWSRSGKRKGRRTSSELLADLNRESLRWSRRALAAHTRFEGHPGVIHVMDREADNYEIFNTICSNKYRFVIRLNHDRLLAETPLEAKAGDATEVQPMGSKLFSQLHGCEGVMEREVLLSERAKKGSPKRQKLYPERGRRLARLLFKAGKLTLIRPRSTDKKLAAGRCLNFVLVEEIGVPSEDERVVWWLATTEPIDTPEQIAKIIDIYRQRWLIEEFFKAIKSGCNFEKLQLESLEPLRNMLAIFMYVAWTMLSLRWASRKEPDTPAVEILGRTNLTSLVMLARDGRMKLAESPTSREALQAIASLGGHIKNNGEPGWAVLWRGYEKVLAFSNAYTIIMKLLPDLDLAGRGTCDQS